MPDAMRILPRGEAEAHGEIESEDHAEGHGFAMQEPVAKPGLGLERMAKGVAKIQQGAVVAGLALIGGDDYCLHPATHHDRARQRGRFEIAYRPPLRFE